jgi:hypothetical protein
LRDSGPDYSFRNEALLRVFCLWVLPTEEALECFLARDRAEYARHLGYIEKVIATRDWAATPVATGQSGSLDRVRPTLLCHADRVDRLGCTEQVAAGTLEPGGALPALVSGVSV